MFMNIQVYYILDNVIGILNNYFSIYHFESMK